ncbi:MAG: hypothetical protein M0R48_09730 [Candidatus Omnitrophica bacterium]|jgi:hypothetical protein|nr:hypothetical protein [Candidatus Omnitrophota bacterium]
MSKKGKCPSLITGCSGRPEFEVAGAKRHCKRCKAAILKGSRCASIPNAGRMGSRTYCLMCLSEIIAQSKKDLSEIERQIGRV